MQYIFIIIGLILAAIGAFGWLRGKKLENQTVEQIEAKRKQQIQKDLSKYDFELTEFKMYAKQEVSRLQVEISQANLDRQDAIQRAAEAQEATNKILASEQGRAAAELQRFKELEQVKIEQENQKKIQSLNLLYDKQKYDLEEEYNEQKKFYESDLAKYESQLNEWKAKQQAINDAILRQKEIEEQEDFYRILIKENDIKDISVLRSIESHLINKEILNKLIYKTFIEKPLNDMEKRVLKSRKIGGIYKITYIKTGESYIGRSVDIGNRWKEHCLSSLSIGSIAHSTFHNVLADKGLHNFTWEVIEEVPKDKQSEREKYWINFYGTKNQFNEKDGG